MISIATPSLLRTVNQNVSVTANEVQKSLNSDTMIKPLISYDQACSFSDLSLGHEMSRDPVFKFMLLLFKLLVSVLDWVLQELKRIVSVLSVIRTDGLTDILLPHDNALYV